MVYAQHPENIFSDRPTTLDPDSINFDISRFKLALTLNTILVAVPTVVTLSLVPRLVETAQHSDVGGFVINAIGTAITASLGIQSMKNILNVRKKLEQANYNQRLNEIADANGMGPKFW